MKNIIEQINKEIKEKEKRLSEKTEQYFASIFISSPQSHNIGLNERNNRKIPPISYLLYSVAGISLIGTIFSKSRITFENSDIDFSSKILYAGIAITSAFGGYKLSKKNKPTYTPQPQIDIQKIKNNINEKINEAIIENNYDWEEFIIIKQKNIRQVINNSDKQPEEKDALLSKIYNYEVIDVNVSEMLNIINASSDLNALKQNIDNVKNKIIKAIQNTTTKQIEKYNSLV